MYRLQEIELKRKVQAYPMPRIIDLIDQLSQANFISTLDLTMGYWQVPVMEEDRCKSAFVTPFGQYEFIRLPFGFEGAPATFHYPGRTNIL